jgi:hypothetical protein
VSVDQEAVDEEDSSSEAKMMIEVNVALSAGEDGTIRYNR